MNPKLNLLLVSAAAVLLAACSTSAPVSRVGADYRADTQARIRLYGQNQAPTVMVSGIDCAAGEKGRKVNVGGTLGQAFGSLTGTVSSESIGIAETVHSRQLGERNGILSRAFFREMPIPAGKAVNVHTMFNGLTNIHRAYDSTTVQRQTSCRSGTVSFVPQAGRDYEVVGDHGCGGVRVFEVDGQGGLAPVPLADAVSCRR